MTYETAAQAAERLGVSVRTVQKWAKEDKIFGAKRMGRSWLIPVDAYHPGKTSDVTEDGTLKISSVPLPLIGSAFTPGKCLEHIKSIEHKADRDMALSEYYFFTAEFEKAVQLSQIYAAANNRSDRFSSATIYLFANTALGRIHQVNQAMQYIKDSIRDFDETKTTPKLHAFGTFCEMILKTEFHISIHNETEFFRESIKHLTRGHKLYACYILAYESYLQGDYTQALGITQTALSMEQNRYPIAEIYLLLMTAICYVNLKNISLANRYLEKAWELGKQDRLIMPFAELYKLLQGIIDQYFKTKDPTTYQKILAAAKEYDMGWSKVYTEQTSRTIATNLTQTEFTIAMLYSKNWRAKEIAAHLNLSERTITNYLQIIYGKLQINGKKDLHQFMLS